MMAIRPLARAAFVIWAILIVAVTIRVAVSPPNRNSVVPIYRAAAERWQLSQSLYARHPSLDFYRYPPSFTAAYCIVAAIPEPVSGIAWRWMGIALFLIGLKRFSDQAVPGQYPRMALLTFPFMVQSFNNGQANVPIIGLILLGTAAAMRHQFVRSALWIAFAAGIKMYPLACGLLIGLVAPNRFRIALLLLSAAVLLMPFLVHDPSYVRTCFEELWSYSQKDNRHHTYSIEEAPRDWTILTKVWLGVLPSKSTIQIVSALAGVSMAGLVLLVRRRHTPENMLAIILALGGLWMTLFGPMTEGLTYCLFAPGAAWIVATTRGRWLTVAGIGYTLHVIPILRDMFPRGWEWSVLGPQAMGTILLAIALLAMCFRRTGKPIPDSDSSADVRGFRLEGTMRTAGANAANPMKVCVSL